MRICVAIAYADVRAGDKVCKRAHEEPLTIVDTDAYRAGDDALVLLYYLEKGVKSVLSGRPDSLIGLVYRPLPEGTTEETYRMKIWTFAYSIAHTEELGIDHSRTLAQLREVIEVYELGRPLSTPIVAFPDHVCTPDCFKDDAS